MKLKPSPVIFEPIEHTYTLLSNGKLVPGVTSITDNLNKPYLVGWAAKMTAEAVKANMIALKESGDAMLFGELVDECKMSWRKKSKDAMDSGTLAHNFIEFYLQGKISDKLTYNDLFDKVYELDGEAKTAVKAFSDWEKTQKINWLASELVVGSQEFEFGGKLDAIAEIDGKLTLVDFKTSSQIGKDYFLQTAGYQICLEEMGAKIEQRLIVRIAKDGSGFETLIVPTPYDLDKMAFLGLRNVQKFLSYTGNGDHDIVDKNGKVKIKVK